MAKGMESESDVSDDDSDSPSIDELLDASLATNYDDLLCKFKLLSKEHEELKLKIEKH
jgi:hypothetical protein